MMKRCWKIFSSSERGAALLEFAICVQILILLFLGGVQIVQLIVVAERTDYMVNMATNSVAQGNPFGTPYTTTQVGQQLHQLAVALSQSPALNTLGNLSAFGNVYSTSYIFTDVLSTGGTNTVQWRFCGSYPSGGTSPASFDQIGATGNTATLPSVLTLNPGEEVLIGQAQTTWNLLPLFTSFTTIYRAAYYIPRTGSIAATPVWVTSNNNDGPC